ARFTQIDYNREMALIGEVDEDGRKKMIGVSRIVSDLENKTAEFAIVVADPWQGKGLGGHLTDKIIEIARDKGIEKIYASVMKGNEMMVQMFKDRDFTFESVDINVFYVEKYV
ncbi:GNAT family N-acetyltransferase, partial [Arthrospira platensis SPKY1]|nr:GNAT family N-acetyltransferase [Arthrospira platensis SPKY1]